MGKTPALLGFPVLVRMGGQRRKQPVGPCGGRAARWRKTPLQRASAAGWKRVPAEYGKGSQNPEIRRQTGTDRPERAPAACEDDLRRPLVPLLEKEYADSGIHWNGQRLVRFRKHVKERRTNIVRADIMPPGG